MKGHFLSLILSIQILLVASHASAQLSEQEQKFLENLKTELSLSAAQSDAIQCIYLEKQKALDECDKSIKEFEKTLSDENELNTRISALNQKKKDIRDMRELDVRMLLRPDQLKIYDEKIKPAKPKVLHFGIHNRADCDVCK